jgi:hypothetical protein
MSPPGVVKVTKVVTPWPRTTILQYQQWTQLTVEKYAHGRDSLVDWDTNRDPCVSGSTWTLRTVRSRCSSGKHIQITLSGLHRSWRNSKRGTHMPSSKTRDDWKVGNLTMISTWKFFANGLDVEFLFGKEFWTYNGTELSCRLVFPWAFFTTTAFTSLFTWQQSV